MTIEQKKILKMTLELHEICNQNQIKHYLICGSCLGAIRNKGFIPWDDDIDIAMTRNGIEKLAKVFQENEFKDRALIGKGIVDGYHEEPYRYVSCTDTSIQRSTMHYDCPLGTYVDILILDPMPKNKKEQEKYKKKMGIYFELSNNVYVTQNQGYRYSSRKYILYKYLEKILGEDFFLKRIRRYLRQFSEEECDQYAASWQGTHALTFSKELFGEMRMEPFENVMLPVPEQAEKFLRECYGDDWMIEPENHQTHVIVTDSDIPYTVYYNDYMKHVDKDEWIKLQKRGKFVAIRLLPQKQMINKTIHRLDGVRIRAVLQQRIEAERIDLLAMLAEEKYDEILNLYSEYIYKQFLDSGGGFLYWGMFLELPDELLYPVWYSLVMRGRIYEANKGIRYRKMQKKELLSDKLLELEELVENVIQCMRILYEDKDVEKAYEKSRVWRERYPKIPQIQYINYTWKIMSINNLEEGQKLEKELLQLLQEWEMNSNLRKCLADIQFYLEKYDKAEKNYMKACVDTRDGIIRTMSREREIEIAKLMEDGVNL